MLKSFTIWVDRRWDSKLHDLINSVDYFYVDFKTRILLIK